MKKIVVGNWKQNPERLSEAKKIALSVDKLTGKLTSEVVVCLPYIFFPACSSGKKLILGAQDLSLEKGGAHTGEVSAMQLHSVGARYVIVGHSERRAMGETSEIVARKALLALKTKLSPIICIGEKERHHDGEHWPVLARELHATLIGISKSQIKNCIISYEPIWAVGKGNSAMKQSDISESAIFIKKVLAEMYGVKATARIRIIYGGSVDTKNAKEIGAVSGISGFLVGRESLKPNNFAKIAEALG